MWEHTVNLIFDDATKFFSDSFSDWNKQYKQMTSQEAGQVNYQSTLDQIPKMTEKKKKIEIHLSLGTHLTPIISKNFLDKFNRFDESI